MKRAARSQSGDMEEGDRDRSSPPQARPRSSRIPWVIILTLPVLVIVMFISIEIFGLLARLFGA
ncbi:MAG TPA: hypothetical protein VJS30_04985 [Paraburkholderia sp.]|nr:hypothetical protein [Paraburkholderia sp.]